MGDSSSPSHRQLYLVGEGNGEKADTTPSPGVDSVARQKPYLRHASTYKSADNLEAASSSPSSPLVGSASSTDDEARVELRRRLPQPMQSMDDVCDGAAGGDGFLGRRRPVGQNYMDRRNSRSAENIQEKLDHQCFVVRSASGTHPPSRFEMTKQRKVSCFIFICCIFSTQYLKETSFFKCNYCPLIT